MGIITYLVRMKNGILNTMSNFKKVRKYFKSLNHNLILVLIFQNVTIGGIIQEATFRIKFKIF